MNKAVKIILAIAIAALFPTVVFLMTMVIYPDYKANYTSYPESPSYEDCLSGSSRGGSSGGGYTYEQSCRDQYSQEYREELKNYDADQRLGKDAASKVTANRIKIALVFVLIGFIIAFVARGISAVAAGLLGGSTILLLFASGFSVAESGSIDVVTELLFLGIFIFLVLLLLVIDKVLPAPPLPLVSPPDPVTQKPDSHQESRPEAAK